MKLTTLMENNQPSGSDSVDNQAVVGDLSCREISLFLTVFVSAFRSIGAEVQDKGHYAGLLMGYRLMAQATMALDGGSDSSKIRATTMGLAHGISAAMSMTDPTESARLVNTALDCINKIHDKIGAELGSTQLVYSAKMEEGQLKIKVEGVSIEDIMESFKDNEEVKKRVDSVIRLTSPKIKPENN